MQEDERLSKNTLHKECSGRYYLLLRVTYVTTTWYSLTGEIIFVDIKLHGLLK